MGSRTPAGSGADVWTTHAWRAGATAWIDARLDGLGIDRTGPVEQPRVRPWATVMTVPTDAGTVWFKAAAPATAFEAALYPVLHRCAPDAVLAPLATDAARGWMLLPDGGAHLGDFASGDALVDAMATLLTRYAALQRSLAPNVDELFGAGVVDMRPAILPRRFAEALDITRAYIDAHGADTDRATWDRVAGLRDAVATWCARLADSPVPASLDHNDLHPHNVLVPEPGGIDGARVYDWGDSVVAPPFSSMLIVLRTMRDHLRCATDDPRLLRLRDAYLDVFSDLGTHTELIETLELACHTGKIARALTWARALGMLSPEEAGEFAGAPLAWLAELLEPSYLGSA